MFRRSGRSRTVKSVTDYEDLAKPVTGTEKRRKGSVKAEASVSCSEQQSKVRPKQPDSETVYKCAKCDNSCPPGEQTKSIHWLQCDECDLWWHGTCARVKSEDCDKFDLYGISFVCAFCVLGLRNCETNQAEPSQTLLTVNNKLDKLIAASAIQLDSPDIGTLPTRAVNTDTIYKEDSLVIIDNIPVPKDFRHSDSIVKELKGYSSVSEHCELAYSLAQGGVAIHLKDNTDCQSFIENWPEEIFGGGTVAHKTKRYTGSKVSAYLRDIPTAISIQAIKQSLKAIKYKAVRRMRYFDSKKPMPILKVQFETGSDCDLALKSDGLVIEGVKKKILFSPERNYKVVRCFSCHRYGHISASCTFEPRCVNCGQEECSESQCEKPPVCVNCGKGHKSSSSTCQIFRDISKKRNLYKILSQQ